MERYGEIQVFSLKLQLPNTRKKKTTSRQSIIIMYLTCKVQVLNFPSHKVPLGRPSGCIRVTKVEENAESPSFPILLLEIVGCIDCCHYCLATLVAIAIGAIAALQWWGEVRKKNGCQVKQRV